MIVRLAMITLERVDRWYVCKWCGKALWFRKDMVDHKRQHEHSEFAVRILEEKLLNLVSDEPDK
jgi:hypothetical protein